jgi:ArsR family transcriptional regulator, arsenate/arsenite/antimonite-responsive transcriptional repressor
VITMAEVNYREELRELSDVLKAMGHPVRLKIILLLAEKCRCVKELWDNLQLPQAVVSQHLKVLRNHGVLEARREGAKVCYLITDGMTRDIVTALEKKMTVNKAESVRHALACRPH